METSRAGGAGRRVRAAVLHAGMLILMAMVCSGCNPQAAAGLQGGALPPGAAGAGAGALPGGVPGQVAAGGVNANFNPGAGLAMASAITGTVGAAVAPFAPRAAGALGAVSQLLPGATSPSGIVGTVAGGLGGGGLPVASNIVGTVSNGLRIGGL